MPKPARSKPGVTLQDLGENALVQRLIRRLPLAPTVQVGPGDDCAVIGSARQARWQLLKTDAVLEGIHFLPEEDLRRVGWKALCRAISDMAAMGGVPEHALITVAAGATLEVAQLERLYQGLRRAARRFGVSLVGGETACSPGPLFVNVAMTGWVERRRCVLRSGGRPGDLIYVTGKLGGSIRGKHLDFVPRLAEARWLTAHFPLHAMMDLSDGLGADLPRLAAASGCGYAIASLPVHKGQTPQNALHDGEDYELLFALAPRHATRLETTWRRQFPRLALSRIGHLTPPPRFAPKDSPDLSRHGFDHFAQSR
jgi:thiamine-monophosphate kinase